MPFGRQTGKLKGGDVARQLLTPLATALLAACTAPGPSPAQQELPRGTWTADLIAPGMPAAVGFLAELGDGLELVALGAMGFEGGPAANLRSTRDSLHFDWPAEGRRCLLARDSAGSFAGTCRRPRADGWSVRLLSPAARNAPVGHARTILARPDLRWESRTTEWGRLHVLAADSAAAGPRGARSEEIAEAIRTGLEILGEPAYDRPVDAFLVAGREEVGLLVGRAYGSTADPLGSTVILAGHGMLETVRRHELMHVLSLNLWGVPPEPAAWLREGIATFAGGHCAGHAFRTLAAALVLDGRILPLATLFDDFHGHSDLVSYLQGASLVQFLLERDGRARLRELWDAGVDTALAARGSSRAELERAWRAWLEEEGARAAAVDWTQLRRGCG